jgi:hypothetical protein
VHSPEIFGDSHIPVIFESITMVKYNVKFAQRPARILKVQLLQRHLYQR